MDARDTLALAIRYHQAGDLVRAEQSYLEVLRAEPTHAHALYLMGALCQSMGRFEEAISYLKESVRLRPDDAPTWNLLGVTLAKRLRHGEAEACFQRVLQLNPRDAEARGNLMRVRMVQGHETMTEVLVRPDSTAPSDSYEACYQRGLDLRQQGRFMEAEVSYRQALQHRPDSADALNNLAILLSFQARLEEAAACCRRAIEVNPTHFLAYNTLATVLLKLDKLDEAEAIYRKALQLDPDSPMAHNNLGVILHRLKQPARAENVLREAVRLDPSFPDAHSNLGDALMALGRASEAQVYYERALQLKPDYVDAHSNWLVCRQYLTGVTAAALAEAHAQWDRQHAAPFRFAWSSFANTRDPERRLRLGFVSFDFKRHPVGYFLVRALEGLLPLECDTVCYSLDSCRDNLTDRIAAASGIWRQVGGLTDQELADQIRADRIDLLFDLAGHTARNRLLLFARKPAPIQITWMGYVGTTGLSAIDYLIADRFQIAPGTESRYRERIIRLPDGYICYDPPRYAPQVSPLPALERAVVTFGSFNNPAKIMPEVVAVWAEILGRLPQARLLLKYGGLHEERHRRRILELFLSQGIEAGRVDFEGWSKHQELLAAYHRIDIGLDTFPYSGGLTTCEALWMGVPVITYPGETFAGRHSLSHLSNAGLTETVAPNLYRYVKVAVELTQDLHRLADMRAGLRERMARSPICDGDRFARNLLEALRGPWRDWCAKAPAG
jgi:predicted O-linked N-acetylglucosamine transferase (SPINDLY family)